MSVRVQSGVLFGVGVAVGLVAAIAVSHGGQSADQTAEALLCGNNACDRVTLDARIEPFSCVWDAYDVRNDSEMLTEEELRACGTDLSTCEYDIRMVSEANNCTMRADGVESITMVTDPANYVDTPLAQTSYTRTVVSEGNLEGAWDISFLPDGTPVVTEVDGDIRALRDQEAVRLGSIDTEHGGGVGLHGLAVDPRFEETGHIYVFYTKNSTGDHSWNRISRFSLTTPASTEGDLSDETVLVEGIRASGFHFGGRLRFGPDGKLYATTGDAKEWNLPQDPDALAGKVLRMNPDGSVPADNPFPDSLAYTMGHRNPQGIAWHPATDTLHLTEHGPRRHDEINVVTEAGANFGWPLHRCTRPNRPLDNPEFDLQQPPQDALKPPAHCFRNYTLAPSGATFVSDPDHPWFGDLFVAGLRGKHLHRFVNGTGRHDIFFIPRERVMPNRLRDVEFHDGSLWILGDGTGVMRITPS